MDAHRVDAFTRALGVGSSRRGLARILGGLALAGGIVGHSAKPAAGKKKKKNNDKKKKPCKNCHGECCDGKCVNTPTDHNNCGACGNVCVPGQYCANGTCTPCESPMSVCTVAGVDYCANLQTDTQNCGTCGNACPKDRKNNPQRDLVCQAGACICTGTTCPSGRCCPAGFSCNRDDGCCPEGGDYCGNGRCCPSGFTCGGTCGQECCA